MLDLGQVDRTARPNRRGVRFVQGGRERREQTAEDDSRQIVGDALFPQPALVQRKLVEGSPAVARLAERVATEQEHEHA